MTVAAFVNEHRAVALMPAMAGGLGWTPDVFNRATLTEFALACQGPEKDKSSDISVADARRAARLSGMPIFGEGPSQSAQSSEDISDGSTV